jgi:hypothetical protein
VHHDFVEVPADGVAAARQDGLAEQLGRSLDGSELAAKVRDNFERYRLLAERDRANIARLAQELDDERVIEVPYLDEDVHDLAGLAHVNRYLFASAEERRGLLERVES